MQGERFTTILTFDAGEQEECVSVPIVIDTDMEIFLVNIELLGEFGGRIQLSPSIATIEIIGEEMVTRISCQAMLTVSECALCSFFHQV